MSYQKNDVLTVKIEDMGHDGEGIANARAIPSLSRTPSSAILPR